MLFVRIIFILAYTSVGSNAYGAPSVVKFSQVRLAFTGGKVWASFRLPCASQFAGIVVQPKSGHPSQIAVAWQSAPVFCTGVQPAKRIELDWVRNPSQVTPWLGQNQKLRMYALPVHTVYMNKKGRFRAAYTSTCQPYGGYLLRPSNATWDLAILERKHKTSKNCQNPYKVSRLPLAPSPEKLGRLPVSPSHHKSFSLAEIPVLVAKRGPRLQVRARLKCNEAPVGTLVSGNSLSLVVAQFHRFTCTPGAQLDYNEMLPPLQAMSVPYQAKRVSSTPLQLGLIRARKSGDGKAGLKYARSCHRPKGVLLAKTGTKRWAWGVVEESGSFVCKASRSLNLSAPTKSNQLTPLKLPLQKLDFRADKLS